MPEEERQWGHPVEGCALSISVPSPELRAGQGVELTFVFRNAGTVEITLPRVSRWNDYGLTVKRGWGEAPRTPFGEQALRAQPRGASASFLEPGQQRAGTLELDRLYDFTQPGRYAVEASKTLPSPSGTGFITVVSNAISFEIVAEPATE